MTGQLTHLLVALVLFVPGAPSPAAPPASDEQTPPPQDPEDQGPKVDLALRLSVEDRTTTECTARVALPVSEDDNPWRRRGDQWRP